MRHSVLNFQTAQFSMKCKQHCDYLGYDYAMQFIVYIQSHTMVYREFKRIGGTNRSVLLFNLGLSSVAITT